MSFPAAKLQCSARVFALATAALPMMAELTGLPLKTIDLPGAGVFYETSNARIRTELGFEPQWTFERMIGEAAQARAKRAS